jgi:hypothetical protein
MVYISSAIEWCPFYSSNPNSKGDTAKKAFDAIEV